MYRPHEEMAVYDTEDDAPHTWLQLAIAAVEEAPEHIIWRAVFGFSLAAISCGLWWAVS
jgi:hypothetical protein